MISAEVLPDRAFRAFSVAKRFQKFLLVGAVGLAINQTDAGRSARRGWPAPRACIGPRQSRFRWSSLFCSTRSGPGTIGEVDRSFIAWRSYIPINTVGLAINYDRVLILVNQFGVHKLLANLIGAGLAAIWNFCLNSAITWRDLTRQVLQARLCTGFGGNSQF